MRFPAMTMRTMRLILCGIVSTLTTISCLAGEAASEKGPNVVIILGKRYWTAQELVRTGREGLIRSGSMETSVVANATLFITIREKRHVCEIHYTQGFGDHAWSVIIDNDGKIKEQRRFIMMEGYRSPPKQKMPDNGDYE